MDVVPGTRDFGAHLVSQAERPVHQRREALADDPTPAYLRDAPLSNSADEICPGLYLSGTDLMHDFHRLIAYCLTFICCFTPKVWKIYLIIL
jgi:hypothetical protein